MRHDLVIHFIIGLAISGIGSVVVHPLVGFGLAVMAGYAREYWGNKDWADFWYTAAGGLVAAVILAL